MKKINFFKSIKNYCLDFSKKNFVSSNEFFLDYMFESENENKVIEFWKNFYKSARFVARDTRTYSQRWK